MVVIIVEQEAQAQLGAPIQVDVGVRSCVENGLIPARGELLGEHPNLYLVGFGLKVLNLKRRPGGELGLLDIDYQAVVSSHGICPNHASLPDLEDDLGDDGVVRDASRTEGEDDAVLPVQRVIANKQGFALVVPGATHFTGLCFLKHPTIVFGLGPEGYLDRLPIGDGDREGLVEGASPAIIRANTDLIGVPGLEVEDLASLEHIGIDGEGGIIGTTAE